MLREVKLSELKQTFFGRASLNEVNPDRVDYLEVLVLGGILLPPIQITPDCEIIDGRHRVALYGRLGYETIQCEVVAGKTQCEYQAIALKANSGGPLPPTRADITFNVTQLQRCGASDAAVIGLLCPPYPKRGIKQQLEWNRSNERLTKFRSALKLRNDKDWTLKQTAEETGLPEAELKEFIRSGGKRRGKNENKFLELKRGFHEPNQSYGGKVTHLFKGTFDAFDGGQLTQEQALVLLRLPGDYGRTIVRRADEAIERLLAHSAALKKAVG